MEEKEYLDKIANSEGIEKFQTILMYAWYLRQKDPLESAKQAKKAIEYARIHKNSDMELKSLTYICYAYFYASDMEKTSKWIDRLEKKGKKYANYSAIGTAYGMKSRISLHQGNTAEAMENALIALDYNLKENNPKVLTTSYFALGMIHLKREENTEAKHYLQLALQIAEKSNNHTQYSVRVNIGNILYNEQKFEDALKEYIICLHYFMDSDMVNSTASVLLNVGLCHRHLGNYETALENMMKSYKFYETMKNLPKLGFAANAIAEINILQSDWDNALIYLKKAEKIAEENNFKSDLVSCYSTYVKFHEEKEEFLEANKYLHKLLTLKDKINIENYQEKMINLETKYKTQIYRSKSTELDEKNKTMDNQIKELNRTLENSQRTYQDLQNKFQVTLDQLNTQGDLLSSQSRLAMMGEMISAIAHQWNQPLSVIWIMAQAIGEAWEFEELDSEFLQNQLDRIGEQIMYMSETVNDFRNFFKSDYVSDFNVAETVEKSIKLVSYIFDKKNIKIIKCLNQNCHISGNPNELVQVLVNIFNNAKDAILRTNPVESFIKIDLSCNNEIIAIKIFNSGEKINSEVLEKIFEPYFTTRGKEGTGIGLYICRNIIENKFKGKIGAHNLNEGVEFMITIPAK
jgi:signal transduction histidine kinase